MFFAGEISRLLMLTFSVNKYSVSMDPRGRDHGYKPTGIVVPQSREGRGRGNFRSVNSTSLLENQMHPHTLTPCLESGLGRALCESAQSVA